MFKTKKGKNRRMIKKIAYLKILGIQNSTHTFWLYTIYQMLYVELVVVTCYQYMRWNLEVDIL